VPSLDEALLEQWLGPVHEAFRVAAADPALDTLVREGRTGDDAALAEPLDRLTRVVREMTSTTGDPAAVTSVAGRRLRRIAERAASFGRAKAPRAAQAAAADPVASVAAAFGDPWHRAVLVAWSVLEPQGALAEGAMVGPTSRAWFDELRLGPALATTLRDRGLDEAQAWAAAERVRLLLAIARPSNVGGRSVDERARRLLDAWLAADEVTAFLRVNTWEGVEWFGRDPWRELLDWVLLLDLVDGAEGDAKSSADVVARLLAAGEASRYRLAALRESVASKPARPPRARTSGAPAPARGSTTRRSR
jgi:hypothetical protein